MISYDRSLPRQLRKARGAFYSPRWIAEYIVGRTVRKGDAVLDPACGAGVFLSAAHRAGGVVTGIDSDAGALEHAATACPEATLIHGNALECDPGTFDVVIGNPPYLSVDDNGWNTEELRARFPEVYRDKTDLSFYFLALALRIAKRRVGMIVSRAFLEAFKADRLRAHIAASAGVVEIVDFADAAVFEDASVATCIVILDKATPGRHGVVRCAPGFEPVPIGELASAPWFVVPDLVRALHERIDSVGTPVGDILVCGQGMQTGRNLVFRAPECELPADIVRKRARNSDISAFAIRDRAERLLYLEDVEHFESLPPAVQAHLRSREQELRSRAAYRRGDCAWWKYTWPLHRELWTRPRILCPYLASANRFALDAECAFLGLTDTTVLFDNTQPEDLGYIEALLNSRLLEFRFRSLGKLKGNGIREYFWNSVSRLPIRRATGNPVARLRGRDLDHAVYELYGLGAGDIELVEGRA